MTQNVRDPFKRAREESGSVCLDVNGETIPLILRFREVRQAAKNWQEYSSDAPFRVPVPSQEEQRSVRQLPIEIDPPEHSDYRAIVEPFFRRPTERDYMAQMGILVDAAISQVLEKPSFDAMSEFALPLQSQSLCLLLGVPLEHADLFVSWGTNVLDTGEDEESISEEKYDQYIEKQLACSVGGSDFFSALNKATYHGRPLTHEEKVGFANLAFAGGRDTIINIVTSVLHYLASEPEALHALREDSALATPATEEFVRVFSPLTFIGRVCPAGGAIHGQSVAPDGRVGICWMSANMDADVFEDPQEIKLDRRPNPHVAFGSGAHTCLGAPQARLIMRTLLQNLPQRVSSIELGEEQPNWEDWVVYRRQNGFEQLQLTFRAR